MIQKVAWAKCGCQSLLLFDGPLSNHRERKNRTFTRGVLACEITQHVLRGRVNLEVCSPDVNFQIPLA